MFNTTTNKQTPVPHRANSTARWKLHDPPPEPHRATSTAHWKLHIEVIGHVEIQDHNIVYVTNIYEVHILIMDLCEWSRDQK